MLTYYNSVVYKSHQIAVNTPVGTVVLAVTCNKHQLDSQLDHFIGIFK